MNFSKQSELAHHWIYNRDDSQASNMFSKGDIMYSYGTHFIIAKFVKNKNGDEALLFNTKKYSNSTSGQQNDVRNAIPYDQLVFHVPGAAINHKESIQYYFTKLEEVVCLERMSRRL